jgi:hypothetical protein
MPELVFFRPGAEVLRVALERPRLVLGRAEGCDVVLQIPKHAVGGRRAASAHAGHSPPARVGGTNCQPTREEDSHGSSGQEASRHPLRHDA